MGASGSKTAVAPILPATQLSAAQVAEAVKAIGESYIPYAEKLEKDGMDGAFPWGGHGPVPWRGRASGKSADFPGLNGNPLPVVRF